MLNIIWCFFILVSIIYGIISGNFIELNNSIFDSIQSSITLIINLFGSICFWNGIMNIVKNTTLINKIKNILRPIIKMIFNEIDEESDVYENISMNMTSNLLGLGNAATPCGLKAMEGMQKENNRINKLSNNQLLFVLINTASIQLIPTTIISIRMGLNSNNPAGIIVGVWFSSFVTFIIMVIFTKIYLKFRK